MGNRPACVQIGPGAHGLYERRERHSRPAPAILLSWREIGSRHIRPFISRFVRFPAGVSGGVRHRQVGHLAAPRQLDTRALHRWRHVLAVAVLRRQRCRVLGKVFNR